MDPIFGTLLTVGGNLLGGLLGRKKEKQPTRVTPLQLRNEALEAGFNPLTVLRGAAGGGFGMNPAPATSLGSMDLIGQAVAGIGDAFARNDPVAARTREMENELLQLQIDSAKRAAMSSTVSQGSPAYGIGNPMIPAMRIVNGSPSRTAGPAIGSSSKPEVRTGPNVGGLVGGDRPPIPDELKGYPEGRPLGAVRWNPFTGKYEVTGAADDLEELIVEEYRRYDAGRKAAVDNFVIRDNERRAREPRLRFREANTSYTSPTEKRIRWMLDRNPGMSRSEAARRVRERQKGNN